MGDAIARIHRDASGAARGVQRQHSLDGHTQERLAASTHFGKLLLRPGTAEDAVVVL